MIFELNCKLAVDLINSSLIGFSEYHFILNKCRARLSLFSNSSVNFVRRQPDQVAHSLTRET